MNADVIIAKLKQYPVAVGCVVGAILLAVVAYLRTGAIPELSTRESELQALSSTVNFNEAQSVGLPEDVEQLRAYATTITDRLVDPDRSRLAINQQYLYELEQRTGVRLLSLSQGEVVTDPRQRGGKPTPKEFVGVPFTVSVLGKYPDVMAFLLAIERGDRLARVDSLSLASGPEESPDSVALSLQFEFLGKK